MCVVAISSLHPVAERNTNILYIFDVAATSHTSYTRIRRHHSSSILTMEHSTPLAFHTIEFMGHDSIEPAFSPEVTRYVIHRSAGSDFRFKATLNRKSAPHDEEDDWNYQPYPGFTLEYHEYSSMYKSFWSPDSWASVSCPPGETELSVSCSLRRVREGEKSFGVSVKIITAEMTPQQRLACTHPSSTTSEGECWGGGSGSCTVELITSCSVCGTTLSTSHEHRD